MSNDYFDKETFIDTYALMPLYMPLLMPPILWDGGISTKHHLSVSDGTTCENVNSSRMKQITELFILYFVLWK